MKKKLMPVIACSGIMIFLVFGVFDSNTHANNVIKVKGIIASQTSDGFIVDGIIKEAESQETSHSISIFTSQYTVIQNEKEETTSLKSLAVGSPVLIEGKHFRDGIRADLIKIISHEDLKKGFDDKR